MTRLLNPPSIYKSNPLSIINSRTKRLDNYSYKLIGGSSGQYGLDVNFSDKLDFDESKMSLWIVYADGNSRDDMGDLLEVGGIRFERHRKSPIVLFDHGKNNVLPIAMAAEWDDSANRYDISKYTGEIDIVNQVARDNAFFYQGKTPIPGVDKVKQNDHAIFCEQFYYMAVKGLLLGGSIGYKILEASPLQPDYSRGIPQGMHLRSVLKLECSLVVMPANQDTVRKMLAMPKICGKPMSPYLVKSLTPFAPERKAQMGYEKTVGDLHWLKQEQQEMDHNKTKELRLKYGKTKLPHNVPQENKVPPAEWRPGVGVVKSIKSIRLKYRKKAQPSDKIDPEKAAQILKDGEVNGQPLTEKQRGMFAAAAGKKSYFSDCPRDVEGHCLPKDKEDMTGRGKQKPASKEKTTKDDSKKGRDSNKTDKNKPLTRAEAYKECKSRYPKGIKWTEKTEDSKKGIYSDSRGGKWSVKVSLKDDTIKAFTHYKQDTSTKEKSLPKMQFTKPSLKEGPKTKDLSNIRKKYRLTKSLRRRLRKSSPGSSVLHIRDKDLEPARQLAEGKGLKWKRMIGSDVNSHRGFTKIKLMGDDSSIDDVATQYGQPVRTKN